MGLFLNLIENANQKNWCTRLYCTTCGAMDYRTGLHSIPREQVIEELRTLTADFCHSNADALRLTFSEIAIYPTYFDLLESLEGTPAGKLLRATLDHQATRRRKREEHQRENSPEKIEARALARRELHEKTRAEHLGRKIAHDAKLDVVKAALAESDLNSFFDVLATLNDPGVIRSSGGLAYPHLCNLIRAHALSPDHLSKIQKYAAAHGGFWAKLAKLTVT